MNFQYGERELKRKCRGPDVAELQLRLAGFRGTVPDDFGTERQVMTFQEDFMKAAPTGVVDRATMRAIDAFARRFPIYFKALKCRCGECGGFGKRRFKGSYAAGKPKGGGFPPLRISGRAPHAALAVRAAFFYLPQHKVFIAAATLS